MRNIKKSTSKAFEKVLEIATSKKAAVLALTTWLLTKGYVGEEVFAAVAMIFIGTIGVIDYKAKLTELGPKNAERSASSDEAPRD